MSRKESDTPRAAQLRIPFTRDARLRLLAEIDPKVAGLSRRSWINVAELLMQVELTTGRDGCFSYCTTLRERMFERRGVPRSTFFRVRAAAGRLGLLVAEERHNRQGKMSNAWRVAWDAVVGLAARSGYLLDEESPGAAPTPASAEPNGQLPAGPESETDRSYSGTDRCQTGTDRSQSGTDRSQSGTMLLRGFNPSSVLLQSDLQGRLVDRSDEKRDDEKTDDQIFVVGENSAEAGGGAGGAWRARSAPPAISPLIATAVDRPHDIRALADAIVRRVGACGNERDWNLAAKCAVISRSLGDAWLNSSIEGVVRRRELLARERKRMVNPWAYFTRVLQDEAKKRGKFLNRELARITLPPELATWRGGPAWYDTRETRLASGAKEPQP
ncbi:MAG: hypothetical protein H0T51_07835 [Pirellulales bacterium]|nr:hypothetical protein [Pirellulales bacterium]